MNLVPQALGRVVATQLAFPTGIGGRVALPLLDRVNNAVVDGAVDVLAAQPGERVADIGFGGGRGIRRLLQAVGPTGMVHAIAPSQTATHRLRTRHRDDLKARRLKVLRAPMHDLPCGRHMFDAVLSTNTVYYIDDLDAAFTDVARVLAPDGRFILGVGDPGYMNRLPIADHGPILRPITAIADRLTAAGFTINDHTRLDDTDDAFHVIRALRQ